MQFSHEASLAHALAYFSRKRLDVLGRPYVLMPQRIGRIISDIKGALAVDG